VLLLLIGCGLEPANPIDTSPDDSLVTHDSEGEELGCEGTHFSILGEQLKLPTGFAEGTFAYPYDTSSASPNWTLDDLGQDGLPEIVITLFDGVPVVGTSLWLIHQQEVGGFGNSSSDWTLPTGFPDASFSSGTDTSSASPNWTVMDIDGDGAEEMVLSYDDRQDVGTDRWLVYERDGAGWSASGSSFSLPPGYDAGSFYQTVDTSSSSPNWGLIDMDGDGDPDLVSTYYEGIEGVGDSRWLVYDNNGSGFSTTGATWVLPSGFPTNSFTMPYDLSSSAPNWAVKDIDGDGPVELVVTGFEGLDEVGTTKWLVYGQASSGFESAASGWALPEGYTQNAFYNPTDMTGDGMNWVLQDLDSDGQDELFILYDSADATLGDSKWLSFDNTGEGFEAEADYWLLPNGFNAGAFTSTQGTGDPRYTLVDIDGDERSDLLVTYTSGEAEPGMGDLFWNVYTNECD
jgi:hypothetical protein